MTTGPSTAGRGDGSGVNRVAVDLRRNDGRTRQIVALRGAGWKRAAIAAQLGIGETCLGYHIRKAGISLPVGRPRRQPPQQRSQDLTQSQSLVHGEPV